MKKLGIIFNPTSIALIGATNKKGHVGYAFMENLVKGGFKGKTYPINLTKKKIFGIKAYASVLDVKKKIDLAIIATPAQTVPTLVEECGKAGIHGVVIISAGFKEAGKEGELMSEQILKTAKKYDMRIIGPNCMGFIHPSLKLNATFANQMAVPGKIAFISQSGALGTAILDWALNHNVGFSYFVSIGSMIDVGFNDLLDYFSDDKETESIIIYMESLDHAHEFLKSAGALTKKKPIVVLKAGKSSEGSKAAKSHTGSLTGDDEVFSAAFKESNILRVDTIGELFDMAEVLSKQPKPAGNKLAIITNAGGPGVIATDYLVANNRLANKGVLAKLSDETIQRLNQVLSPAWSKSNPLDLLGDADALMYKRAVEECIKDKNVDGILIILTHQAVTDSEEIAKEIVSISCISENNLSNKPTNFSTKSINLQTKPILAAWMGEDDVETGRAILRKARIPVYDFPEKAVNCFINVYNCTKQEKKEQIPLPHSFTPNKEKNKMIIQKLVKENRNIMTEPEAKQFLANYEIPVSLNTVLLNSKTNLIKLKTAKGKIIKLKTAKAGITKKIILTAGKAMNSMFNIYIADNSEKAVKLASSLGFPVVMKIVSPDIIHKTEAGGVKLNLKSPEEVNSAFADIIKSAKRYMPNARIEGVLIEPMISKKYELIIGSKKDSIFGPVIIFGFGGTAVEVYKDINIGLLPLDMTNAKNLIEETKISVLLKGYRGQKGVNMAELEFILCKFSQLIMDFPDISEIDINPFGIDETGGIVIDAKIILDKDVLNKKLIDEYKLLLAKHRK
ncbi:acetate--CoA ligase family protein [Candidatus Woesearchaeota archaeon]|nr:acetate--CoA ligase family protein [Candidatus Woesearchaeota archaeon]